MRGKPSASGIRDKILDPLRNFKHEVMEVPEWDSAKVIVRALSAGDWLEYRRRALQQVKEARAAAGLSPEADNEEQAPDLEIFSTPLYAFVLARTLFELPGQQIFSDHDVPELAQAYSPVHDRLVAKALELSGVALDVSVDPVDTAGNA
uniref:phage tail assembly chaperone n=1 Tax=Pseudomonas lundensis TaxID=86185 RepID=UPI0028D16B67|nr:phage tail assembly chaperone [Pseudomonas lundensis]